MVTAEQRQPLATRAPGVVALAVLLVVPGTALSIAFSAIGLIMLAALGLDWMARTDGETDGARRLPVLAQLGIGVGAAAAVGGAIALGAWII